MTRVIVAHADALRREIRPEGVAFLSALERARWAKLARPARREQFLLGRWLLRRVLVDAVGGRPGDWRIAAEGPPRASHARGWRAPWLSLSHSGPWLAVALSPWGPVGVDLEQRGRRRPWRDLARHQGWRLNGDPEAAFLRQWTAFEARYKAPQAPLLLSLTHPDFALGVATSEPGPLNLLCLGLHPPR